MPLSALLFAILLVASRVVGHVERFRIAAFTGTEITSPHRRQTGRWYQQVFGWLRSGATWKELGYHLEHHAYPRVPTRHCAELARRLEPTLAAAGARPTRVV